MVLVRDRDRISDAKLEHRSQHAIFVGMSNLSNGWVFLLRKSGEFSSVTFTDSKDVSFNELFEDMR